MLDLTKAEGTVAHPESNSASTDASGREKSLTRVDNRASLAIDNVATFSEMREEARLSLFS